MAKNQATAVANVSALPSGPVRFVGVDDGHFGIKVWTEGTGVYIASRIAAGTMAELAGSGQDDNWYEDEAGRTFTVSSSLPFMDTRLGSYATSAENHVLIHHALMKAGMGGHDVSIVTGLPVNDYFLNGQMNADLIDKKISSLAAFKVRNRNESIRLARVVQHTVHAEAIAAFYDLAMDDDGGETEVMDQVEDGSIAIVDIGGKTTDVAVVINGGSSIDATRSGSANLGGLSLNAAVEVAIKRDFRFDNLTPTQVDRAVRDGSIRAFGKENDCADIVKHEKGVLAQQIITELRRRVRDGADLEAVYFVGGGAQLLQEELHHLYPHAVFVPDPQFSNARGMWKAAKYLQAAE